ncbi:amidohydrolase family protein [Planctomicrobium sp. SH661]|uniref:amidohydrolase family protein n=1 Tax=Planctomicrobium sp. SH661 TaxID=3448124 RepID=UPI003F5C478B
MLVDTHTNLFWYPDHLSDEFVDESWAAKKAKLRLSPDVHCDVNEAGYRNNFDSRPQQLLEATRNCDKVIVFAIQAPFIGIRGSQESVADFVRQHADRYVGWCSVDPNDPACVEQLTYYVQDLGLRGLKLGPIYQNFDPSDPKHLPLFKKAEALGIPIIWHQGTSFVRKGPLKYSNPVLLEDIAIACPELRMIIAHMGHPWETECCVLIRKHPHLYANTSALHYRPLRHYQAFMTALEYGVEHKLIFGSDFPSATPEQAIAGLWKVNDIVEGTRFPRFPQEALHRIIHDNWKQAISFQ